MSAAAVSVMLAAGSVQASASASAGPGVSSMQANASTSPDQKKEAAIAAAQAKARATGEPVVVDEMTSPTEQTSAMPDGTMQYEVATRPVRAEKDGTWVPVNTDLVRDGDWIVPEASAVPVRFGTGGSDALAQVQSPSGEWISETWPYGDLPSPTVDGDTATYESVFPGVDLKLAATKTGMASIYVIWSEEAALSAPLANLHVAVEGATLAKDAAGTVVADPAGASTPEDAGLVAGQPLWWDSSEGGTYREPGGEAPPMPVEHEVTTNSVKMDIGESLAAVEKRAEAPEVQYPLFVDPDWSAGESASWYTDAAYPNQSYLSAGVSDVLRVGIYGQYRSDMFFQAPISALKGKQIVAARLGTRQLSVDACGAKGINIHAFGPKTAGFTWAQEQSWNAAGTAGWSGPLQGTFYGPDCGSAALNVNWNVTSGVRARLGASLIQFAVTYADPNAPSRRHYSRDATLTVAYDSAPNVPTSSVFTAPSASCSASASSPLWVSNAGSLTMQANFTDPDAGTSVYGRFQVVRTSDPATAVWSMNTALGTQGNRSATIAAGTLSDGDYAWEAQAIDAPPSPATPMSSGWSSKCYFNVRNTGPSSMPSISLGAGPYTVGEGTTVTFGVKPSDGVSFIAYTVTSGPASDGFVFPIFSAAPPCGSTSGLVKIVCPGSSTTVDVTLAPTSGVSTIWAVSYDKAGNPARLSGTAVTDAGKFGASKQITSVNSPAVSDAAGHVWRTVTQSSPLGESIPDTNTTSPVNLVLGADTLRDVTANPINPGVAIPKPVLGFVDPSSSGLSGPVHSSSAVAAVNVDGAFTLAAWLKPGTGGSATAVSVGADNRMSIGATADRWQFCVKDTAGMSTCVTTPRSPAAEWTHVAGVSDAVNGRLLLYVDGALAATVERPVNLGTAGASKVDVGVTLASGTVTGRWSGQIADPAVFAGVATASQLTDLRSNRDPIDG